ncbi:MAG: hypothetical protein KGM98_07565 [Bacteroidota bacterium]|nr:hypothetical protein [Bacteroidota bacterium]
MSFPKNIVIAFRIVIFLTVFTVSSCQPHSQPKTALEHKLIETMGDFLHKTLRPGTTFKIREVSFYEDTTQLQFMCRFKVDMHYIKKDTTGIMVATISKDFSKVVRSQ